MAGGGGAQGGAGNQGGQGGGGIPWLTATNSTALGGTVRAFFEAHGVTMDPPKAFFFNDRNGTLMVRASLADLDIVEEAIEVLNKAPQQVTIESRIAEFTQEDMRALGFDWWVGNVRVGGDKVDMTAGTMPSLGPVAGQPNTGIPGGNGIFPGPGPAGTTSVGPSYQAPSATDNNLTSGLTKVGTPLMTVTGILTDPQFRVVLRAMENRNGIDLLSCPKITTLSGRQAQIKAVDIKYIVTEMYVDQTSAGGSYGTTGGIGGGGGTAVGSSVQPVTEPMEVGPTLDVIPSVSADGYTIQLTLIPTLKEFLGYDDPGQFNAIVQSVGGVGASAPIVAPTPLPKFRLRQVITSCVVWDGQTVVLGGLIGEDVQKVKDKVPILGDLPMLGRLFRSESSKTSKKNLAIFVTPTLIDPAGNRLHSDDEMPFRDTSIPAQKTITPVSPTSPAPSGVPAVTIPASQP
jgi:general secretion pathway protein D